MSCVECERIRKRMLENLRKDIGLPKQEKVK